MLQASKLVNDPKLSMGFIQHSLDEYKHTKYFLKLLNETNSFEKKELRFSSIQCYQNGFLNNNKYLFEKMSLKQFSVFIGVNEKLALKAKIAIGSSVQPKMILVHLFFIK